MVTPTLDRHLLKIERPMVYVGRLKLESRDVILACFERSTITQRDEVIKRRSRAFRLAGIDADMLANDVFSSVTSTSSLSR